MKRLYTWVKTVLATIVVVETAWLLYRDLQPAAEEPDSTVEQALTEASPLPAILHDSSVRRAGFFDAAHTLVSASTMGAVTLPTEKGVIAVVQQSEALTTVWPVTTNSDVYLRLQQLTLAVTGESASDWEVRSMDTNDTLGALLNSGPFVATDGISKVEIDAPPAPGRHVLVVMPKGSNNLTERKGRVGVRVPDGTVPTPSITEVINNSRELAGVKTFELDSPIPVYSGYLKIKGLLSIPGQHHLAFLLFQRTGTTLTYERTVNAEIDQDGAAWTAVVKLPSLPKDTQWTLVAMNQSSSTGGNHNFTPENQYIHFKIASTKTPQSAPKITGVATDVSAKLAGPDSDSVWTVGLKDFRVNVGVSIPETDLPYSRMLLYEETSHGSSVVAVVGQDSIKNGHWQIPVSASADGIHKYHANLLQGDEESIASETVSIRVLTKGPVITGIEPPDRSFGVGRFSTTIHFDGDHPLNSEHVTTTSFAMLDPSGATISNTTDIPRVEFLRNQNSVRLIFPDFTSEGTFTIVIKPSLTDIVGNPVRIDVDHSIPTKIVNSELGIEITRSSIAGVAAVKEKEQTTGPYVTFQEYTQPRTVPEGFNPSDKVETRVARLYYFRDAHRVAQIVNRKTRSYNRQAVDMAQQQADQARSDADDATTSRRTAEAQAIEAARKTREAEQRLDDLRQQLTQFARNAQVNQTEYDRLSAELERARTQDTPDDAKVAKLKTQVATVEKNAKASQDVVNSLGTQVESAMANVQNLRDEEVRTNETLLLANEKEEKLRAEQFRREAAAAHADPDTYAPGKPTSNDPVEQVSVSVIGEGVIQLRGPLKGINIIRKMINEIDSPVGQVRVAIHTLQVNGENANRMERSIGDIQRSIDQSRFLTLQSAEMLRKAVTQVAALRATDLQGEYPAASQAERDIRYLDSFFGADFINELRTLDSEFLHTGNKVLSLNSMDSTSLANALFIMALAKNSTRQDILQTFDMLLQSELPRAEESYLQSSFSCKQCTCKDWFHDRCCKECYCPLACNARFESLRGFFNGEIAGDDTLTPIQREFIRLAQIFKARLVTEMEYKQRVVERAVIEERIGAGTQQYLDHLRLAKEKEDVARQVAEDTRKKQHEETVKVQVAFQEFISAFNTALEIANTQRHALEKIEQKHGDVREDLAEIFSELKNYTFTQYKDSFFDLKDYVEPEKAPIGRKNVSAREAITGARVISQALWNIADALKKQVEEVDVLLADPNADVKTVFDRWVALKNELEKRLWTQGESEEVLKYQEIIDRVHLSFKELLRVRFQASVAREEAELARRPLDHKKFLDMLVDELEDKYIELLEGTRAHTANIDNYIKRLSTALEDDFNTQFYFPTFRMVRQAGRYRDVTFGQIETTSILTNNRELGKVEPQATMEFDLPKRDILITEAMKGAKAAVDEYGALLNDPTFLSLAKMGSGMPTASQLGGASAGFSSVRNVLPGLNSSTQEAILCQSGPGDTQIGSAFESLIPDPAIYKFETGTGFEIRPVMQPDGQAVVFDFQYMYTTNIREPVRADEKHLGRVKRHYIDTDVQLSNYELREISRYQVQLKASRTSRGVPLLEDVPVVGVLFRPLPQQESSLQENLILGQTVIYPTLFDLMGLRWAPAVADLDPLRLSNEEFLVRGRHRALENRVYDHASSRVDDFLRVPEATRRQDLYRTQESIPMRHPNGYYGPGLDRTTSELQEGYQPGRANPEQEYYPSTSPEGNPYRMPNPQLPAGAYVEPYPLQSQQEGYAQEHENLMRVPSSEEVLPAPGEVWEE